ncbi:hypothetical protein V5O48_011067 [Marasmius crinis-equi]|uniref:C-type lectin domain-containing protein n=1 Tax=Marasmius crinis-equi TaxID=585013 RepID=A0ABR3F6R4_9AGAR
MTPLAKFVNGLGFFGKFYLQSLKKQLNWHKNEIWLDPKNGQLCQGPAGPECYTISRSYIPWKDLPCSAELLQEGNCLPFLAGLEAKSRVDREVVKVIAGEFNWGDPEAEVHQPTILSTLTNTTVAVSGGLWRQDLVGDCLGAREVMENGMTRFTLEEGDRLSVWIDWVEERRGWISQATSVFHRCGVSLTDDLSQYELLRPDLSLAGDLSDSEATRQRRWEKPIYLFVGSLSPSTPTEDCTTSSLHHWSFDPTGQHPLPAETCEHLGLPIELSLDVSIPYRCRWNKEAYKWMHQYQLARGFDPKTTDFARHLGYLIYQVQSDSDRSEDVDGTLIVLFYAYLALIRPGAASPAQSSPVVSTSKTTSTSPDLHMPSRTPGNAASRLPTKSTPSVSIFPPNQPQIQPRESTRVHRTVTRDAAKPGMTSGKASPDSLRTRTPLTSEPIHIASSSPELRTPKRDAMTSASSRSAKPSSSVVRISRPQAGPNLALNAGTSRNGSGMGGDEQTKTPCKGARQRRDPGSIPTPTRPINVHERSSSMRVWK